MGGVSVGWSIGWEITFENGSKRSGVAKVMSSVGGGANEPAIWLADIPCGYHELRIEANDAVTSLIVTPGRCWLPDQISHGGRAWGISMQLCLLRSARNWGIGDFTDLARFAALVAGRGCDVLDLKCFQTIRSTPVLTRLATRNFLNILYIDPEAIPEFLESRAAKALLQS